MNGLVDLHCHILPQVDDGPSDLDTAVALVQGLESIGFTQFYPTPHQKLGSWTPGSQATEEAAEDLRRQLRAKGSTAVIHPPGAENMWDSLFTGRQEEDTFPMYPGGQAFLVEFDPHQGVPTQIMERLFKFRLAGLLPVVAHVERYPIFARNPERMAELGRGAALLVNLSALDHWWWGRLARKLVRSRLVHAASTDGHNSIDTEACRKGINWLRKSMGDDAVELLLDENPRRIVAGELPDL